MKKRFIKYIKLNIVSLVFIAISSISITLAWFAYSGLATVKTEIGVKAWEIKLKKGDTPVSNEFSITLPDIYPGMEPISEIVNITNNGDADALVKYNIISARILDDENNNYVINNETTSEYVEDLLSHYYPFHINMNLTKGYALANGGQSVFGISASWPLDSGDNQKDGIWGNDASLFRTSENDKYLADNTYQVRPSIEIKISVTAEQDLHSSGSSDYQYNLGDTILYDVASNTTCSSVGGSCINTYILDVDNKVSDTTITLLPDLNEVYTSSTYDSYSSTITSYKEINNWNINIETRELTVDDLLKIVSRDITDSLLIQNNISDSIIGNLKYNDRLTTKISETIQKGGLYSFLNEKFTYLTTPSCYWTSSNYNDDLGFALKQIDENNSKIYGESKGTTCKIVPVIIMNKPSEVSY